MQFGRSLGLNGLEQISEDFLDYIPSSRTGVTPGPRDHVVSFTGVTGKTVTATVMGPRVSPNSKGMLTIPAPTDAVCSGAESADVYFNGSQVLNYGPNGVVNQAIIDAMKGGYQGVVMPPPRACLNGVCGKGLQACHFNFLGNYGPSFHWALGGPGNYPSTVHDLVIDMNGATLNFNNPPASGIVLKNLNRVVFKNMTLDWPHLRVATLGKVVSTNFGNELQVLSTYPNTPIGSGSDTNGNFGWQTISLWNYQANSWGAVSSWNGAGLSNESGAPSNASGQPIPATYDPSNNAWGYCIGLSGNALNSCTSNGDPFANYPPGSYLIVRHYADQGASIYDQNLTDVEFSNITINAAAGVAFSNNDIQGLWVHNYTLQRLPGRVISSTADGLDVTGSGDVILENNNISYQGDDGINLGGTASLPVISIGGNSSVTLCAADIPPLVGDELMFLNSALGPLGFSRVTAVQSNAQGVNNLCIPQNSNIFSYTVTVSGQLPANLSTDSYAQDLTHSSPRYVIRNNQLWNSRARGILDQSSYGLIQGNVMSGQGITAAIIGSFANDPLGSYGVGVHDLTFINNQISSPQSSGQSYSGVMFVNFINYLQSYSEGSMADSPINKNILISNNKFENTPGPGLFVSSASNITVSNNAFFNTNSVSDGSDLGVASTGSPMVFVQSDAINGGGNCVGLNPGLSVDTQSSYGISVGYTTLFSCGK